MTRANQIKKHEDYLKIAISIAKQAGRKLLKKKNSKLKVIQENNHDLKLREDAEIEKFILEKLNKFTKIQVLSEEQTSNPELLKEKIWIVDPIDGTVNYFRGIPIASVSIALWENQEPLLGVVYDFFNDVMYYGLVGKQAYKNKKSISVSNTKSTKDGILLTGMPVKTDFTGKALLSWTNLFSKFRKVRLLGSASISLCYVACGNADEYQEKDIQLWDVAAGLAIVKAAGGKYKMEKTSKGKYTYKVTANNGILK